MSISVFNAPQQGLSLLTAKYTNLDTLTGLDMFVPYGTIEKGTASLTRCVVETTLTEEPESFPTTVAELKKLYSIEPVDMKFEKDTETGFDTLRGVVSSRKDHNSGLICMINASNDLSVSGKQSDLFNAVAVKHNGDFLIEGGDYTFTVTNLKLAQGVSVTENEPLVISLKQVAAGAIVKTLQYEKLVSTVEAGEDIVVRKTNEDCTLLTKSTETSDETSTSVKAAFSFTKKLGVYIDFQHTFTANQHLAKFSCPTISLKSHYPGQNYGHLLIQADQDREYHYHILGAESSGVSLASVSLLGLGVIASVAALFF